MTQAKHPLRQLSAGSRGVSPPMRRGAPGRRVAAAQSRPCHCEQGFPDLCHREAVLDPDLFKHANQDACYRLWHLRLLAHRYRSCLPPGSLSLRDISSWRWPSLPRPRAVVSGDNLFVCRRVPPPHPTLPRKRGRVGWGRVASPRAWHRHGNRVRHHVVAGWTARLADFWQEDMQHRGPARFAGAWRMLF